MENREEIIELYDLYSNLLTEKQRNYFEDYYYMDLSISEISENYSISRNGVYDQIKKVVNTLKKIEEALKLKERIDKIENLNIDTDIKNKIIDILKE